MQRKCLVQSLFLSKCPTGPRKFVVRVTGGHRQVLPKLVYACSATKSCLILCDPMNQVLLSIEFSREEYWSRLPFPSPADIPDLGNRTHISCTGRNILYH